MSFHKAAQLLDLATTVAARRSGITLAEVMERHEISKRTAQRMLHRLEDMFQGVESFRDDSGHKRWRMSRSEIKDLIDLTPEELASLDLAVEELLRTGQTIEAKTMTGLREKILALVPTSKAVRLETDHEALLEAQGLASRPGPRPRVDPEVSRRITEAIKACRLLEVLYQSQSEREPSHRLLAPYGILTGFRRYLVGKHADDLEGPMRLYRIGRFLSVDVTPKPFERDPSFSLREFAKRSFGVYQRNDEYGQVVWKFSPEAAEQVKGFEFHPDQELEECSDGSVVVRFRASGHLEMCWHLYAWGDKVEVLFPDLLKAMVHDYRRSDFPAMP